MAASRKCGDCVVNRARAFAELLRLRSRNQALEAEVADLKSGLDAIEERARSELGMIDNDETFYQFVRESRRPSSTEPGQSVDTTGNGDQPASTRQ